MVRIMNTPPANFGIPTLVAANAPPLTPKTSGDTSGSFALEISSRWQCNPAPEPLLKAGAPMDVGKQQADPQKQAKSVTSSGFPYPFLMQGVAVTNEPRNAPSGEPSGTPNASASTRSGTGEALPTDSQGTSAREITLSWGTAGIASAAFGLRLPISAGSVASTQTTGIPASPFSLSSNFSQISHKVEPAGVITPPVAEQTNPVGLPVVEERGHSLLGTASSAVNVTNQTSSPDTQQDAKAVAVASSPAAGQTEQVGRWQVQDAASLGANAILNPAAQLNLTDRPETYWAHGQPAAAFPATTGETKNAALPAALHDLVVQVLARQPQVPRGGAGESNPQSKSGQTVSANLPVAGTSLDSLVPGAPSAAGVFATPSESSLHELVSQILARQPQALGDGVGQSNPQPKSGQTVSANPPVAGTSLDSLVPGAPSEARILVTQPESFLGKPQTGDAINLAHDAGQDKDGNTAVTAGASGTEGNPRSPGSSRGVTVTVPSPSSNPQLRSPASDKSKESDRVGSSPSSKEGTPRTDRTAGAVPDWTQAGGDTDAAADGSSPGGQTASATDRSPVSLKIASLVSAGQKVVAAEPDTGPGIAIDPSQAMRRGSDAQRDSATTSTESAGRAAPPALQNWDAIRQQLGQIVSSAHLAEAMGQSELQVDMKSDSLGPVSVRAILNNGQIGAEIQVSNHDARAVLTEGLHTLEKTLGEKGLQVVNLDVSQGLDYSHAQSQGQQGKQAGQAAHAAKGYTDHSVSKPELSEVSNTANWTGDFVLGRVSVHA